MEIDPDGLRVHRATVETIQRSPAPDRWSVTTDRGTTTVDNTGIGSVAVPLDPNIQADLYIYWRSDRRPRAALSAATATRRWLPVNSPNIERRQAEHAYPEHRSASAEAPL